MKTDIGSKPFWVAWIIVGAIALIAATAAALVLVLGVLADQNGTTTEDGRQFSIPSARVDATVRPEDGAVDVHERLNYVLTGTWRGLYRDIPLRDGERIDVVGVTSENRPFVPGANTALRSAGAQYTWGTTTIKNDDGNDVQRIVLHLSNSGSLPIDIEYVVHGAVHVSGKRALLNLTVWGNDWQLPVKDLQGTISVPSGTGPVRSWSFSKVAKVTTKATTDGTTYRARDLPSKHRIEVVTAFPSARLRLKPDAAVVRDDKPTDEAKLISDAQDASSRASQRRSMRSTLHDTAPVIFLLAGLLALAYGWISLRRMYNRHWRELPIAEATTTTASAGLAVNPPDDLAAPLAAAVVSQSTPSGDESLVATILELVRRGVYRTVPAEGTRGNEVDIALLPGRKEVPIEPYEKPVKELLDTLIELEPDGLALSRIKPMLKDDKKLATQIWDYTQEYNSAVSNAVDALHATSSKGAPLLLRLLLSVGLVALGIFGAVMFAPRAEYLAAAIALVFALVGAIWLAGTIAAFSLPSLYTTYTPDWAERGARWRTFERSLHEFAHMKEEQTASLEIWERLLVLGAAFGLTEAILRAVKPDIADPSAAAASGMAGMQTSALIGFNASTLSGLSSATSSISSVGSPSSSGGGGSGGGSGGGGGGGW